MKKKYTQWVKPHYRLCNGKRKKVKGYSKIVEIKEDKTKLK